MEIRWKKIRTHYDNIIVVTNLFTFLSKKDMTIHRYIFNKN